MPTEPRPQPTGADQSENGDEQVEERIPPITLKDVVVDIETELAQLRGELEPLLSEPHLQSVAELHQYLVDGEGSWTFGENFIDTVGCILNDASIGSGTRVRLLTALVVACLRDDFILVLHQDRKRHLFMNYADRVDRLPDEEQKALTSMFVNMFEQKNCSEWLLYISEWQSDGSTTAVSNIRITTKVAVNALLCDADATLQQLGTAIMYNLAVKEVKTVVFDDVATELAMAVLQYFQSPPSDEQLMFRCLTALDKFAQVSRHDVPQLIAMIGPAPGQFRGLSARCDQLVAQLEARVARDSG